MKKFEVSEEHLAHIKDHALQEYPSECCGMIFGPAGKTETMTRIRSCKNVQDEYNAQDPQNFPRTSKTAYFIAPTELLQIQKELRENKEEIRVIYHSHCDHDAYFSEEDQRVASFEGRPAYPGVQYLVISVKDGKVAGQNLFCWDEERKEFIL